MPALAACRAGMVPALALGPAPAGSPIGQSGDDADFKPNPSVAYCLWVGLVGQSVGRSTLYVQNLCKLHSAMEDVYAHQMNRAFGSLFPNYNV